MDDQCNICIKKLIFCQTNLESARSSQSHWSSLALDEEKKEVSNKLCIRRTFKTKNPRQVTEKIASGVSSNCLRICLYFRLSHSTLKNEYGQFLFETLKYRSNNYVTGRSFESFKEASDFWIKFELCLEARNSKQMWPSLKSRHFEFHST